VNEKLIYSTTKCGVNSRNNDGFRENLDIISDIFIIDYNTMFGLRLLVFQSTTVNILAVMKESS
jgi:hypothetical protein